MNLSCDVSVATFLLECLHSSKIRTYPVSQKALLGLAIYALVYLCTFIISTLENHVIDLAWTAEIS